MSHGHMRIGEKDTPKSAFYNQGRFGRLFPALPPFASDTKLIRDALAELGAPGGPMDAGDDLSDPITLITDPAKSVNNPDNPTLTAGFTFLGQFLDHDMTFDPTSSLARQQDPESIRNFRIPALDLDSVYGGGPGASPYLYDSTVDGGRTTLLVEAIPGSQDVSADGSVRYDLPRNSQNTALTGDPRNDENLIVSQLHLAIVRFHNVVVADVKAEADAGHTAGEIFAEAQRVVRWHYQWLILHEFLVNTVGQDTIDDVLAKGPRFFKWRNEGDEAPAAGAGRPRRSEAVSPPAAHPVVVLRPARGRRPGRRPASRAGRRPNRRRGDRRADHGRRAVLPAPEPGLGADLRHRRLVHHGRPAQGCGGRRRPLTVRSRRDRARARCAPARPHRVRPRTDGNRSRRIRRLLCRTGGA